MKRNRWAEVATISAVGLALSILLASVQGQEPVRPVDDPPIADLLVISNDESLVADIRERFEFQAPLSKLRERFDAERFVLERWGGFGAILIDQEVAPIRQHAHQRDMLEFLTQNVSNDLVVRRGDLPPADRSKFDAALDRYFPWHSRAEQFDSQRAAFGVSTRVNVTIHGQGGTEYKNVPLAIPRDMETKRNEALAPNTMPPRTRPLNQQQIDRIRREGAERAKAEERAQFHFFGGARPRFASGMREASRIVDGIVEDLEKDKKRAADELFDKIGLGLATDRVPSGRVSEERLPQEIRQQMHHAVSTGWEAMGFRSLEEAREYMRQADGFQITFNVGLYRLFQAGSREQGIPSSGMTYNFVLIRP